MSGRVGGWVGSIYIYAVDWERPGLGVVKDYKYAVLCVTFFLLALSHSLAIIASIGRAGRACVGGDSADLFRRRWRGFLARGARSNGERHPLR